MQFRISAFMSWYLNIDVLNYFGIRPPNFWVSKSIGTESIKVTESK